MGALYLPAREAFFDGEVEADQGEDCLDRFCIVVHVLGRKCIDGVLMQEFGIA